MMALEDLSRGHMGGLYIAFRISHSDGVGLWQSTCKTSLGLALQT